VNLLEAGLATSQDTAFEVLLGILAQRLNTPDKTRLRGFSSSRSGRRMQRGPSTPPRATGYRAHPYNIAIGLPDWQSRDPIGSVLKKTNPLNDAEILIGSNLYEYVKNKPVSTIDPYGLITSGAVNAMAPLVKSNTTTNCPNPCPQGYVSNWQYLNYPDYLSCTSGEYNKAGDKVGIPRNTDADMGGLIWEFIRCALSVCNKH